MLVRTISQVIGDAELVELGAILTLFEAERMLASG